MHADINEIKKQARAAALVRRDALGEKQRAEKNALIADIFTGLELFRKARCLFIYVSVRSEVDTRSIILTAQQQGTTVCVPLIDPAAKCMVPCAIRDPDRDLHPGMLGIPEPDPRACPLVDIDAIDLAVVPGLAFTVKGHRIGYGGGYYDRFLEAWKGGAYALAFEEQIVECLPFDPLHDRAVGCIITEKRVLDCTGVPSCI